MPYVSVEGCRIGYEREGSGPALVLLHGAAQDNSVWYEVSATLSSRFDVIAIDQPGHGKSQLWNGSPLTDVADFAAVIPRVLDVLGVTSAGVVGHSLGGAIALRLALDHPELVTSVVNIAGSASSAGAKVGYPGELLELVELNPTDWMETNFRSLIGRSTPDALRWHFAFDSRRIPSEVILGDLRAYTTCGFIEELPSLDCPVLCIAGEQDWSCDPERVTETSDAIGALSTVIVLSGVGHMPQLEVPDEVARLIASFL